jgi:hypothetical protein
MDALKYIKSKFALRYLVPMPIMLPFDRERGLSSLFNELGYKVGAEIGTSKGRYAQWLFSKIKDLKLFCVDPWEVYARYVEMNNAEGQRIYDDIYEQAKERLKSKNVVFVKKYSMDAVKDFEDESLDFVYIDANHTFEYAVEDISEWERKVKYGGIVSGHDYWNSVKRKHLYRIGIELKPPEHRIDKMKLCQVKDAVDAWTKTNIIKPWFITNELGGEKYGGGQSWFYVRT